MNEYYELLGLSPGATKAEVKAAFLNLCKEYHPDKLPPGTPEKARRLVEEHFKKINAAYQVLTEQEPPPKHRADPPVARTTYQAWRKQPEAEPETPPQYRGIFNPQKMNSIAERLEQERREIDLDYQRRLQGIQQTISRRMAALGLRDSDLKAVTGQGKITFIVLYALLALLSLMILSFTFSQLNKLWLARFPLIRLLFILLIFVSFFGLVGFGVMALKSLFMPIVSQIVYNQAQKIKQERYQALAQAQFSYQQAKQKWQQQLRQQIDFYKTVPIHTLTPDYVASLAPEHQFFLLQALRERPDFGQLEQSLRDVAQITIAMGILNILFGATTVVK